MREGIDLLEGRKTAMDNEIPTIRGRLFEVRRSDARRHGEPMQPWSALRLIVIVSFLFWVALWLILSLVT